MGGFSISSDGRITIDETVLPTDIARLPVPGVHTLPVQGRHPEQQQPAGLAGLPIIHQNPQQVIHNSYRIIQLMKLN